MSKDTTRDAQLEFHFAPVCQCGCGQPLEIARNSSRQAKYVVGHHAKSLKIPFAQRFWSHVAIKGPDECWLWQAAVVKGYGKFKADDRKMLASHRIAYELTKGPIPEGLLVCQHLFAGTPKDNTQDMVKKGRKGDVTGELHGRAKLTNERVIEMREIYAQGGISREELAERYGVAATTVHNIVSGRDWMHVGGPITTQHARRPSTRITKISANEVREIRDRYSKGGIRHQNLADEYGVCREYISQIIRGEVWRNI
jgi:uncharacterized protein (DUF433 family)